MIAKYLVSCPSTNIEPTKENIIYRAESSWRKGDAWNIALPNEFYIEQRCVSAQNSSMVSHLY